MGWSPQVEEVRICTVVAVSLHKVGIAKRVLFTYRDSARPLSGEAWHLLAVCASLSMNEMDIAASFVIDLSSPVHFRVILSLKVRGGFPNMIICIRLFLQLNIHRSSTHPLFNF